MNINEGGIQMDEQREGDNLKFTSPLDIDRDLYDERCLYAQGSR